MIPIPGVPSTLSSAAPRTVLACLPWHALDRPSLQLGVLRATCLAHGLPAPSTYHGSLRFADYLLERTAGAVTPYDCVEISEEGFDHALGDWVFAGTLFGPDFGVDTMREQAARDGVALEKATAMREHADGFVDLAVDEILALEPELVGFSSTFMQNVPSLAVAERLKRRRPDVLVVFGGGNCDGEMGVALHQEFRYVDLVLRGEADETFPALLRALGAADRASALAGVPGLCWRDGATDRVNPPPRLVPPVKLPTPDFGDWFAAFDASAVSEYVDPVLVAESARGCWWGELHHCTFCGLNGSAMQFRAKPATDFVGELTELVSRHQVLDVIVVDNIIDVGYLRTALPDLSELGWDLRLHYEIKANLSSEQIAVLKHAGVYSLQPGIESLVDDVLKRMDKGVPAVRNVRTMRDCASAGLTVAWNWLYGLPGERAADYAPVVAQLPALVHLQPPSGAGRIELNRFSPHFNDPSLGFAVREPAEAYRAVYDLPDERLMELVYRFATPPAGLSEAEAEPLKDAVARWRRHYQDSTLERADVDGGVLLRDRRYGWPEAAYLLEEPREVAAWRELERGRTPVGLHRQLGEAGLDWSPGQLRDWLGSLRERGLVFVEGDRWVALATTPAADRTAQRPAVVGADA